MDGHQVPQQMVMEVGDTFKRIATLSRIQNSRFDE